MKAWVAIAGGALDIVHLAAADTDAEIVVSSVNPNDLIGLAGPYARFWRRLVAEGPLTDDVLSASEQTLVREYADAGIASADVQHVARVTELCKPWFLSPLHEMVCAVVAEAARQNDIRVLVIKGPMLNRQGLRERRHSGDVDVWVEPGKLEDLAQALSEWGWSRAPGLWASSPAYHSITMTPSTWGCEIDLHRHMPGFSLPDDAVFEALMESSEFTSMASRYVLVPSKPAHAVIAALHCMRSQYGQAPAADARAAALESLTAAGSGALQFATTARAAAALEDVLRSAFPEISLEIDYRAPLNWRWRTEANPLKRYVLALMLVPAREWPGTVRRVLWPNDSAALLADRMNGGDGRSARLARIRRLWRGLSQSVRRSS